MDSVNDSRIIGSESCMDGSQSVSNSLQNISNEGFKTKQQ